MYSTSILLCISVALWFGSVGENCECRGFSDNIGIVENGWNCGSIDRRVKDSMTSVGCIASVAALYRSARVDLGLDSFLVDCLKLG